MDKIRIVGVRDGVAKVEEIEVGLKAMQEFVGGYVECVGLDCPYELRPVDLWCDEEFLFKEDKPIHALPYLGGITIGGDFFFASVNERTGETISLSDDQIEWVLDTLKAYLTVVFPAKSDRRVVR